MTIKLQNIWIAAMLTASSTVAFAQQPDTATPAAANTTTATVPTVKMKAHYTDAPETHIILPQDTSGNRVRMPVDADTFQNGRSVKAVAQLDPEFSDYMMVPNQNSLAQSRPALLNSAKRFQKGFGQDMKAFMGKLKNEEQERIIHTLSVLIALDIGKPAQAQKYTVRKVMAAYERDFNRDNSAFMHATNLVINHRDSIEKADIIAIQNHGRTHFNLAQQKEYIALLTNIEVESKRVLKEGPHLQAN